MLAVLMAPWRGVARTRRGSASKAVGAFKDGRLLLDAVLVFVGREFGVILA